MSFHLFEKAELLQHPDTVIDDIQNKWDEHAKCHLHQVNSAENMLLLGMEPQGKGRRCMDS